MQKTGQPLPLHAVQFIDEQNGWAVGEYGGVIATTDAGKTWQVQRRGGMQAALLLVHARASELPADTLAQVGAADGYLATGVCVTTPDFASACADAGGRSDALASGDRHVRRRRRRDCSGSFLCRSISPAPTVPPLSNTGIACTAVMRPSRCCVSSCSP